MRIKLEYIEVVNYLQLPTIELKNIQSFVRLAELYNVKVMLKKTEEENGSEKHAYSDIFLFPNADIMYLLPANNFKTIEDYYDAWEKGFEVADDYYEARKSGIATYKEYADCKKAGVVDRNVFLKAQKSGFIAGFDRLKAKIDAAKWPEVAAILNEHDSAVLLSEFSSSKGFKDFYDLEKVFIAGFTDKILYNDAYSKGFFDAATYKDAVTNGFNNHNDYQNARQLGIKKKLEYDKYMEIKSVNYLNYAFDEFQLVSLLRESPNGKKMSLKKIFEMLDKAQEKYLVEDENGKSQFPFWYSRNLTGEKELIHFLKTNIDLKSIGFYDAEGEYFEIFKVSKEKIFIDASNVAFHNVKRMNNEKPTIRNLQLVVSELLKKQFRDISIIADASLKHALADSELINEVKQNANYLEAPARTSADEFLIQFAKKEKCFIVSNDNFSDWKIKDSWIAENIDKLRVSFMIDSETVIFSNLS